MVTLHSTYPYGGAAHDAPLAFKPYRRMLPGINPLRGPRWPEITEAMPVTVAALYFVAHLLFLRLLRISRVSRWVVYTLPRWKTRPKDSLTTSTGAKPGGSGTVSKRLPRYADMSRSASAWRSPWCGGGKSPARKLLCGAECVMDSKWSDADGAVQVRFRHGGPVAEREPEPRFSRGG
jgi:hypothetical protein